VILGAAFTMVLATGASSAPVQLSSTFSIDEVRWVRGSGDSTVSGKAFLKLRDGSVKNCAGFNIELLPVAAYSSERIFKTYGSNEAGQVLLEDNPPKFTPDVKEYHEYLLKSSCDAGGEFRFEQVPAGNYYVMAFIIWDVEGSTPPSKAGGGVMKRIQVTSGSHVLVDMR
jgi:hypothetical protein